MRTRFSLPVAGVLAAILAGCGTPPVHSLAKTRTCLEGAGLRITSPSGDFVAQSATVGAFRAVFPGKDANAVTISFGENAGEAKQTAEGYVRFHGANVGVADILFVDKNAVLLWKEHPSDADSATITGCLT